MVVPTDVPAVLKIVEALFSEGAPRESYPSDEAPKVPLLQMGELKLAAKRLDSGKAPGPDGIPKEVVRATSANFISFLFLIYLKFSLYISIYTSKIQK